MINIDNTYYISSDSYQYILQKKKINKENNKEYYSPVAYLSSIERCIEAVMKIKQREVCEKDLSLVGALHELEKINKEIRDVLNNIGKVEKL